MAASFAQRSSSTIPSDDGCFFIRPPFNDDGFHIDQPDWTSAPVCGVSCRCLIRPDYWPSSEKSLAHEQSIITISLRAFLHPHNCPYLCSALL